MHMLFYPQVSFLQGLNKQETKLYQIYFNYDIFMPLPSILWDNSPWRLYLNLQMKSSWSPKRACHYGWAESRCLASCAFSPTVTLTFLGLSVKILFRMVSLPQIYIFNAVEHFSLCALYQGENWNSKQGRTWWKPVDNVVHVGTSRPCGFCYNWLFGTASSFKQWWPLLNICLKLYPMEGKLWARKWGS